MSLDDETALELDEATFPIRVATSIKLDDNLIVDLQILFWPDKRSYTRQPAAELHCPGSPGLMQLLLERLIQSGCRRAEPGEFTMRAFLAGRLDLAQAEAVMGVIDAKIAASLRLRSLSSQVESPVR